MFFLLVEITHRQIAEIRFLLLLLGLLHPLELISITFLTYFEPTNLNRHIFENLLVELFVAEGAKLGRFLTLLLDGDAQIADWRGIVLRNPFSNGAVDDVEAPVALDNQLEDVIVEGQHFLVDLGVSNVLLDSS